ncbi:MAG: RDD family protein [Friedmanniella sp.]
MATPAATKPDRLTGLPPGVSVGPLGRRLVAQLVDLAVPLVLLLLILGLRGSSSGGAQAVVVIALVLIVVWCVLVGWMVATRAAGPGMRLMKLQLVGFNDGRPIGWVRFLVRTLFLVLVTVTVVGLVVMVIFLLRHPRYQGWHDLAADSVVIVERALAPRPSDRTTPASVPVAPTGTPAGVSGGSAPSGSAPPRVPAPTSSPSPRPPGGVPAQDPVPVSAAAPAPARVTAGSGPRTPRAARPTPTKADTRWVAVLDDGREVPVQGLVLLGRNPQPRPGEEGAELIKLADESRTVSKSHLALGLDESGLFVTDRGSTNGSMVTTAEGARTRCAPGAVVHVAAGSVVSMGNHWFKVRRD